MTPPGAGKHNELVAPGIAWHRDRGARRSKEAMGIPR